MSIKANKRSHWFTVADAFIMLIAIGLIAGAAFLFLMPNIEQSNYENVTVILQIDFDEKYEEKVFVLEEKEPVYFNDEEIGFIVRKTPDNRTVYAKVDLRYSEGVYYLNDTPLRINGSFELETKLDSCTGNLGNIQREA